MSEIGIAGQTEAEVVLPSGLHPRDPGTQPEYHPGGTHDAGTAAYQRTGAPFSTGNGQAIPVYQRASEEWAEQVFNFSTSQPTAQLSGRRPGRVSLTVWVPTTATVAVLISRERGSIDAKTGVVLSPGDSVTIQSEAPVYGGLASGQTTGLVYVLDFWNPPVPAPE